MTNATDIAEFMEATDHPVRTVPTANIADWERILRAKLVLSEALEFVEAMGCGVNFGTHPVPDLSKIEAVDRGGIINLVEAADACADLRYVVIGSENTLGIPGEDVFNEVHRSNMTKIVDGSCMKDADNKVIKPPGYSKPDVASVLLDAGWIRAEHLLSAE
jgi:predicted HAD superfamily Cof-like phosphohydrolase